jgi:hypothetical protein
MSDLRVDGHPELQRPILVAAWAGWNDAGESATGAIRFILRRWREPVFASIDPDPYYDFTQARPRVRLENGERVLDWPSNAFTAHHRDGDPPDMILLQGIEPHLAWRSYTNTVLELCRAFDVRAVVTLGALLGEVSHARPVPVSGSSDDPELRRLLDLPPPQPTGYQGPTGIVGVLNNAVRDAGIPTASIWASVPHYVNASPNPKGTLALLEQLNRGLDLNLRLHDLEVFVARFDAQVAAEVAKNPEMVDYARKLEEQQDSAAAGAAESAAEDDTELPDASSMVEDLERFLREQRRDDR